MSNPTLITKYPVWEEKIGRDLACGEILWCGVWLGGERGEGDHACAERDKC